MLVKKRKQVYELRRRAAATETSRWRRKETRAVTPLDVVALSGLVVLFVVLLDWGDKKVPTVFARKSE